MPHRYFYDTVAEKENNGKKITDTIWHRVSNMSFTNQLGKKVSLDDLHGKILVVDFFFTTCPTICPGLALSMKRLQNSFRKNDSIVQFVSISIDPERDSVPRLRAFADKYNANHDTWWFLTGDKKQTYDLAIKEMKANIADVGADTAFPHTENFFLLDTSMMFKCHHDFKLRKTKPELTKESGIRLLFHHCTKFVEHESQVIFWTHISTLPVK